MNSLRKRVDKQLKGETKESLLEWLAKQRNKPFNLLHEDNIFSEQRQYEETLKRSKGLINGK